MHVSSQRLGHLCRLLCPTEDSRLTCWKRIRVHFVIQKQSKNNHSANSYLSNSIIEYDIECLLTFSIIINMEDGTLFAQIISLPLSNLSIRSFLGQVIQILLFKQQFLKLMSEARDQKPVIKGKDISPQMQLQILAIAKYALDKMHTIQQVATHLKDELNRKYNGDWHAFVGRNFGSYVTYEANHYIYFYIGQYGFLIWKTVKNG